MGHGTRNRTETEADRNLTLVISSLTFVAVYYYKRPKLTSGAFLWKWLIA
jgi:hypothetical protein